jgi:selenium metabolism protein YedF
MNKVYDARGQLCPKPLMMAKKAINESVMGESFYLIVNDELSKENVENYFKENQVNYKCQQDGKDYMFIIQKTFEVPENTGTATVFRPSTFTADWIVLLKSPTMGQGPEELGKILLQAFLNTLLEKKPGPAKIILYNTAIQIALEGSPFVPSLQRLEKAGAKIMICGTCIDYFKVKSKIKVGTISNMQDILDAQLDASKVLEP